MDRPELRSWFLRDVLDTLERTREGAVERLYSRLPDRLKPHANLARLRQSTAVDSIVLDDAEALLACVETALGDGSGAIFQQLFFDLTASAAARGRLALTLGDFAGSVSRLKPMLELPFVNLTPEFEIAGTDTGLVVSLRFPGRRRCSEVFRHWVVGTLRAIERFVHDPQVAELTITSEVVTDRARVFVAYRRPSQELAVEPTPALHVPRRGKPSMPSLRAEVDRILGTEQTLPALDAVQPPTETGLPPRSSRYSVTHRKKG